MNETYLAIDNVQLILTTSLLLINIIISVVLQLGLGKQLWIAGIRAVVQLLLIGYVLEWVFTLEHPPLILLVGLIMTTMAGLSSVQRTRRRFQGIYFNSILSILVSTALITGVTITGIIHVDPWYDPQYLIPLLGMILGNALTGITLAIDRFMDDLTTGRDRIEAMLALGATRWEAAHDSIRVALRTGMTPTINSMMVMGIVSLPGMMTGQILAGARPTDAVRYQIIILFAIAAATALASIGGILLAFLQLFSPVHQLRLDRLRRLP